MAAGPALLLVAVGAQRRAQTPCSLLYLFGRAVSCAEINCSYWLKSDVTASIILEWIIYLMTWFFYFFFFNLNESLSCETGCRYAFVSLSHHLLLVGLVTRSAVWPLFVGFKSLSKSQCSHTKAVGTVVPLVLPPASYALWKPHCLVYGLLRCFSWGWDLQVVESWDPEGEMGDGHSLIFNHKEL